jgi:hypothetical protein
MTDGPRRAVIEHERKVNTYAELWHASRVVLEKGLQEPRGSSWQFLSSLVLTAFAFEAYLNHAGDACVENWANLERLGPLEKLRRLSLTFKVDLGCKGERPLQTLRELIKVRNVLAHGRSETLTPEPTLLPIDAPDFDERMRERPTTFWEKHILKPDFAARAREDVERVLGALHAARPDPDKERLFHFGFHSSSGRIA